MLVLNMSMDKASQKTVPLVRIRPQKRTTDVTMLFDSALGRHAAAALAMLSAHLIYASC